MSRRLTSALVSLAIGIALVIHVAPPAHAVDLFGTAGADSLTGTSGSDNLVGKGGNDNLNGGLGSDLLVLGAGKDVAQGGFDPDVIIDDDGKGGDELDGGAGDDVLQSLDGASDTVDCGTGSGDQAIVDTVDAVESCEEVLNVAGEVDAGGSRLFMGSKKSDGIIINSANGIIYAGLKGDDTFSATSSVFTFALGGAGVDSLTITGGDSRLVDDDGKPGDQLTGGPGADTIIAADGAPTTVDCGAGASDTVVRDSEDTVTNCETTIGP